MKIEISEQEILTNPNNFELGRLIRKKYWDTRDEMINNPDEHVGLVIDENGMVTKIIQPTVQEFKCSICGEETSRISEEHLLNGDHLKCVLEQSNEIEKCVVCGRETRYTRGTHIDMRVGYVEGAGQGCDGSCGGGVPY